MEIDPLLSGDGGYNQQAGQTFPRWEALLGELEVAGVRTVSQLGLLCGGLAWDSGPAALFVLRGPDEAVAASVARGGTGFVWAVAAERARPSWTHLLGAGVICGSAGMTGRPLAGLGVGELRQELAESRKSLHDVLGYAPLVCCPSPRADGVAVDGLVEREALRAGYEMILEPGRGVEAVETKRFSVWRPPPEISGKDLADWMKGDPWLRIREAWNRQTDRWFA